MPVCSPRSQSKRLERRSGECDGMGAQKTCWANYSMRKSDALANSPSAFRRIKGYFWYCAQREMNSDLATLHQACFIGFDLSHSVLDVQVTRPRNRSEVS